MKVNFENKSYTLTQDAYACGAGSDSNFYAAHAVDDDGNDFMVYWLIDRPDAEDACDCVSDWDVVDHVESI